MSPDLKRIFLEACVLIAFGVLVGLTVHHQLVLDAFSGRLVPPPVQAQESLSTTLPVPTLLDEVQKLIAEGGLLVDARSPELYAAGHIEGATSLPMVEIDEGLAAFMAKIDRDRTLVTYCSGFGCPDSFDLGLRLIAAGFTDVRVFEGGFPEWRDAGLAIAGEEQ